MKKSKEQIAAALKPLHRIENSDCIAKKFSAAFLHHIISNSSILKDSQACPGIRSPSLANLAKYLNLLREVVNGWNSDWEADQTKWKNLGFALALLGEALPKLRDQYVLEAERPNLWNLPDHEEYQTSAKSDLFVFDNLVEAVQAAMARGLPHAINFNAVMIPKITKWTHFAVHLENAFHSALPQASKASGYRFIVEITPLITGEVLTFTQVQKHLKDFHRVKRDEDR